MGGMSQQQIFIETIKENSRWWIPILVALIAAAGGIVAALIKRQKK